MRLRPAAILASLCLGCASPTAPPVVMEDGASLWRRIESEHFLVESNLPSERKVRQIASDFETLWHAFASVPVLGLRPPTETPVVVVLRETGEYRYLAGDKSAGLFLQKSALGPLILLPPNNGAFEETAIKHELAHFIVSGSLAHPPTWLGEGLAQVMETASYDTRNGVILFGSHSLSLVYAASFRLPTSRVTETWPAALTKLEQLAYYGRSWLLVHYLIDHELQPFLNFIVRIRNGDDWPSALGARVPAEARRARRRERYYGRAQYGLWTVAAHLPELDSFHESTVSLADALALRSVLHAHSTNPARAEAQNLQAANEDLQAARDLDPGSARVRRISSALEAARD